MSIGNRLTKYVLSLHYEKYLAANLTVPVYPEKRSECAQNQLCVYDARYEQDLYHPVCDRADHYADQTVKAKALIRYR